MKKEIQLSKVLKRELKGKVLSRVAKDVGISVSLLHDWHSSARMPSARNIVYLKKLADHLGLTLEEVLFDCRPERKIISTTSFSDNGTIYKIIIEKMKGE